MAAKDKLLILVHPELDAKVIKDLEKEGHKVGLFYNMESGDFAEADLILGPNCWRVTPDLTKFVKTAVTAARATKKRRTKKSG